MASAARNALGVGIALAVTASWLGLLGWLLARPEPWTWAPLALVMTFLYTGLFITAHDAMHGTIAPGRPRLNAAIGWACTLAYAMFSYRRLHREHHRHHATPAAAGDPDWHGGGGEGFWRWYARFMAHYVTVPQLVGMAIAYNVMHGGLGVAQVNLLLFWVAPSLASTLQLFYFGTYRVHRTPAGGHRNRHKATSSRWPMWLSFLTCYHFGLHLEHHAHPHVPWWALPRVAPVPVEEA